ncbi:MAG TPA: porin family protein [Pseudomonas sp.]
MRHATSRVAAAVLLAAASLPAMAQYDSVGLYMFGHVGQSSIDEDIDASSLDDDDTAYKLGLGLQLNRYFAIEGTWVDLGEFSASDAVGGTSLSADVEISGFGANLVGRLPFDHGLSVYAKAGWHQLESDASVRLSGPGGSFSESDDETDTVNSWAVGAAWQFYPQFSVVGEYERYLDVGDDVDVEFWSLGLRYDLL